MAPPTPVYDRFQISSKYGMILSNPEKFQCTKKRLTQNECTFKITYQDRIPQVICLPFTREFQRCLFPIPTRNKGKEVVIEKWINIETTDESTNKSLFTDPKYKDKVKAFLQADKDLKHLLSEDSQN